MTSARTVGLNAAYRSAQSNGDDWAETAAIGLNFYACIAEAPFTIEMAREWLTDIVPAPKDDRAWGAATHMAIRSGYIEPWGYAPAVSSNGSPKRTYVHIRRT